MVKSQGLIVVLFVLGILVACSSETQLSAFSSDGCSLFPDASLINQDDWCECCFEHDIEYWKGGTQQERQVADDRLKQCVYTKTNNEVLANILHQGVRFGGSPYFYNWYRWGYGWNYDRKYQALTDKEINQAKILLAKYHALNPQPTCISK